MPPQNTKPPELSIQTPNGKTQLVALERDRYELGRAESNALCFQDVVGLSRKHLVFERDRANWVVRDLGSTNGTFVNGARITGGQVLRSKDRVNVGELSIVFTENAAPVAPAAQTVVFIENPSTVVPSTTQATLEGVLEAEQKIPGGAHMKALIHAGRELAGHTPLEELFDLIMNLSIDAVGASRGVLMTVEQGDLQVRASRGAGFRISSHVRDLVLKEKRSLLVQDALKDADLAGHMSIVAQQIRSMLAVPLQTKDRVIGLIYLDAPGLIHEFTKEDLNVLTVLANIAAIRIEHARLAEVEQAEKLRDQELEHAALIQRSILPANFPPFPQRKDFELHASMVPAKEVGGDLFDFFLLDKDHLGFVIGDVSGKGVPAALFMSVCRTLLRATAQHQTSPGDCFTYVNASLAEQNVSAMFVTLFYGVLDTHTGELQFANGGHNPPYIFSRDGKLRPLSNSGGPLLGVIEGIQYQTATDKIASGEAILLYTDGVTEAIDRNDEFFGEQRLEEYLAAHASEPAEQLVQKLHLTMQDFSKGVRQADDITVLALRYLG
jgi:sigma-B regulation protein RsbU (phosphoserine phosphatase)